MDGLFDLAPCAGIAQVAFVEAVSGHKCLGTVAL